MRGRVARKGNGSFSEVIVTLDDFQQTHADFDQPYIFGTGFSVTGVSTELDLTDPFTDLKVALDLPESDLPHFGVYNAYIPSNSCIFNRRAMRRW